MALTADQIKQAFNEMVGEVLKDGPMPLKKADIKNAIKAADIWLTNSATSYNTALPQPFRGAASGTTKAALLAFVAMRRSSK